MQDDEGEEGMQEGGRDPKEARMCRDGGESTESNMGELIIIH